MMQLTIIGYRPNNDEYACGCHVGSSDSDFQIYYPKSKVSAIKDLANILFDDMCDDCDDAPYEITILIDGIEPSNKEQMDIVENVMEQAKIRANELFTEHQRKNDERKRRIKEEEAKKQRERDLKQLAELKAKLEVE